MMKAIPTLRKPWLVLAAAVALLAVVLLAGTLFAANERQEPELLPASKPLTMDETDPGLSPEYLALVAQDDAAKAEAEQTGDGVNQVAPEQPEVSSALARWLDDQPETMGFITREDAMTADPGTMDWLLYQAVYKDVLTQEEADIVQAWYDRRPSTMEAPELLQHQPVYLDRPGAEDEGVERGLLLETEDR